MYSGPDENRTDCGKDNECDAQEEFPLQGKVSLCQGLPSREPAGARLKNCWFTPEYRVERAAKVKKAVS